MGGTELTIAIYDELNIKRHVYSRRTGMLVSTEVVQLMPDIPLNQQWPHLVPPQGFLIYEGEERPQIDLFNDDLSAVEPFEPAYRLPSATIYSMETAGSPPRL